MQTRDRLLALGQRRHASRARRARKPRNIRSPDVVVCAPPFCGPSAGSMSPFSVPTCFVLVPLLPFSFFFSFRRQTSVFRHPFVLSPLAPTVSASWLRVSLFLRGFLPRPLRKKQRLTLPLAGVSFPFIPSLLHLLRSFSSQFQAPVFVCTFRAAFVFFGVSLTFISISPRAVPWCCSVLPPHFRVERKRSLPRGSRWKG